MEKTATTKIPIFLAVIFTFVGLLLFAVFILLAGVGSEGREDRFEEQRAKERLAIHDELLEADLKMLGTVGWVNEKQEIAHVPIDWGIERAMAELSKKPVTASDVAVPPPMPAQPPQAETPEAATDEGATSEDQPADEAEEADQAASGEAAGAQETSSSTTAGEASAATGTPAPEEAASE